MHTQNANAAISTGQSKTTTNKTVFSSGPTYNNMRHNFRFLSNASYRVIFFYKHFMHIQYPFAFQEKSM